MAQQAEEIRESQERQRKETLRQIWQQKQVNFTEIKNHAREVDFKKMEREIQNSDYGLDRLEVVRTEKQSRFESQRSSVDQELHKRVVAQNVYSRQVREIQKPIVSN